MYLTVELVGHRQLVSDFDRLPETVKVILRSKAEAWSRQLEDKVRTNIENRFSGSGKTANAVEGFYGEENGHIVAGVRIDLKRAPGARIQEEGGVIPAHIIRPRDAKRLAFIAATGDKVIVRQVFHPGAVIQGQHFMKDAYRDMSSQVATEMKRAVIEGIRASMHQGAKS
jgi:hypothetical protein